MAPTISVLHLQRPLSGPALAETLDGGQCFRWRLAEDGTWHGVSGRLAAAVAPQSPTTLQAVLHAGSPEDLQYHLADDIDWHALADTLPWRSDPHLATCLAAFPGLRLLRQPIGETLLGFLCSATKQIVQIRQMVALLADRFGEPLPRHRHPSADKSHAGRPPGDRHPLVDNAAGPARREDGHPSVDKVGRQDRARAGATPAGGAPVRALPTWEALASVSEQALRGCLLGFRARHVAAVAAFLAARPGWLDEKSAAPYAEAKRRLMELPGVGEKIADCVLLFGAARLEAFPVDVWILRVMQQRYGLHGWDAGQIAQFGRIHFGPYAGLAQQYLFAWERRAARAAP